MSRIKITEDYPLQVYFVKMPDCGFQEVLLDRRPSNAYPKDD
jgi:hypothetical protein